MTSPVISSSPQTTVKTLSGLMLHHRVKRVPVLLEERLIGIVSRRDVLRATTSAGAENLANGDEGLKIAATARILSDLGFGPDLVMIDVRDGSVTLEAHGLSSLQLRAIKCVIENLPGASLNELTTMGC